MHRHIRALTLLCVRVRLAGCDFFRDYAEVSSAQMNAYQDHEHLGFY
jgi:hypothetical protein